jgi:hypothetical protein
MDQIRCGDPDCGELATPETVVEMGNLTGGMLAGLFPGSRIYRCPSGHVTTKDAERAVGRPTFTRIAAILWGAGVAVFLGSIIVALIYIANAKATDEYAGWTILTYPLVAAVVWIPLGFASLVIVIIALARRERGRPWAIALLVVNVVSLPFVWECGRILVGGL